MDVPVARPVAGRQLAGNHIRPASRGTCRATAVKPQPTCFSSSSPAPYGRGVGCRGTTPALPCLFADAEALAAKLAEVTLTITAKAEEGRIFGSVTAANLAEALEKQGISVDRKNIALDAVKTVGQYEATVKIYKGIQGTVKFGVVAEE